MRIVSIGGAANSAHSRRRGAGEPREAEAPEIEGRDLVTIGPAAPSERAPRLTRYPAANFLAQLIATRAQAPQTRARRRAEPAEATEVYRSMTKPVAYRRSFGTRA